MNIPIFVYFLLGWDIDFASSVWSLFNHTVSNPCYIACIMSVHYIVSYDGMVTDSKFEGSASVCQDSLRSTTEAYSFRFKNFSVQIFLLFFQKCLLAPYLTLFRLSSLPWFGSCNHCILACFHWSKNCEHSSSNHGLSCFSSYRHRLCS
jgi:hypothetical protein